MGKGKSRGKAITQIQIQNSQSQHISSEGEGEGEGQDAASGADESAEEKSLYDAADVVNRPAYDTKHLDKLHYNVPELSEWSLRPAFSVLCFCSLTHLLPSDVNVPHHRSHPHSSSILHNALHVFLSLALLTSTSSLPPPHAPICPASPFRRAGRRAGCGRGLLVGAPGAYGMGCSGDGSA